MNKHARRRHPGAARNGGAAVSVAITIISLSASARSAFCGEPIIVQGTGADECSAATVIDVPVGPPGQPITVTVLGDRAGVTGPDCDDRAMSAWWETFRIDECADVTIDACGNRFNVPQRFDRLITDCNGLSFCRSAIAATEVSLSACPDPEDPNVVYHFASLPPGTYHYPLAGPVRGLSDTAFYGFHIRAEQCTGTCSGCLGACCDPPAGTCEDDVFANDCRGPGLTWVHATPCCEVECRPRDTEYDMEGATLLSRVPLDAFSGGSRSANTVWGYVSPSGREYAILGLSLGTGFVDVTDPRNPAVITDIPDAPSIWSDMKTYRGYAYNVNEAFEGPVGMQVIDINRIDDGVVELVGVASGGLISAHNVAVNPQSGFLYPCATNLTLGFLAYDLRNPADPQPAGFWDEDLAHDLQVVSYDSCPYAGRSGPCEIAFVSAGPGGLKIVDVTEKNRMTTIGGLAYTNTAYTHQGWLSEDRRYFFVNDEFDERVFNVTTTTYVLDVADPARPTEVTTFTNGLCAIDHNLMTRGRLVMEANYTSGLRVWDVGDIGAIEEIAHFDTSPADNRKAFDGAWGVYADLPSGTVLVSDIRRGLFAVSVCPDDREPREDVDGDNNVTLADFAVLQRCFGRDPRGTPCLSADFDCDRDVDAGDAALFVRRIGAAGPRRP